MNDKYNLERFRAKHEFFFETALAEIKNEKKVNHWMWFIFPQLKFLGRSRTALYYGIENTEEAKEFYNDPYLGSNLKEICKALLECKTNSALEVFGFIDEIKLCSCMTLFYIATGDEIFKKVLDKFYGGKEDTLTTDYLKNSKAN